MDHFSVHENPRRALLLLVAPLLLAGCQGLGTRVDNSPGYATMYEDVSTSGSVSGIGIESQDITSMTDRMMREMLANPTLSARATPPRIQIDSSRFVNEGASRINKNMITDKLRIELNRAANGRMVFIGRESIAAVDAERALKRSGTVDGGTIRRTAATGGVDFFLVGRITSEDAISIKSGATSRYQQFSFEMQEAELGTIVWGGMYEMRKAGQDDIIYR